MIAYYAIPVRRFLALTIFLPALWAQTDWPVYGHDPCGMQPFPLKPPPLARNRFRPNEIATVTPEHESYCQALLAQEGGALTEGPYRQYGPKLRLVFPAWGGNRGGMSYDPLLGYLPSDDGVPPRGALWNSPLAASRNNGPEQRVWRHRSADTGDIASRVPLGSFEELDAKGVRTTGTPNRGGSIVTAGGLVFIAATVMQSFGPGKSGKQHVAAMASGGVHYVRPAVPGKLYVYALP